MNAILQRQDNVNEPVLHLALELSNKRWKPGFGNGDKRRRVTIDAGDWVSFQAQLERARAKLGLPEGCRVVSCYEAGRDGFWIHRTLVGMGIENVVVDSASIEVNRRLRRAKTDNVDVESLLRLLQRHVRGEKGVFSVVRVPTLEEEDLRRLHRERERLVKERGSHKVRIQSLLVLHGVRLEVGADFLERLETVKSGTGDASGEDLKAEMRREFERHRLADRQLRVLETEQRRRAETGTDKAMRQVNQLRRLKGVGWQSSWVLVMELFGWRCFRNRRQLAACVGLTPTPYASGDGRTEQGIGKAGSRRVRKVMVELSWLALSAGQRPDALVPAALRGRRQAHAAHRHRRPGAAPVDRPVAFRPGRGGAGRRGAEPTLIRRSGSKSQGPHTHWPVQSKREEEFSCRRRPNPARVSQRADRSLWKGRFHSRFNQDAKRMQFQVTERPSARMEGGLPSPETEGDNRTWQRIHPRVLCTRADAFSTLCPPAPRYLGALRPWTKRGKRSPPASLRPT